MRKASATAARFPIGKQGGMMNAVFICDGVRTPIGRYGGVLSSIRSDDLAAMAIDALLKRNPSLAPGA
ncbi:MAG: hypothetical protein EBX02_10690, partial [Betaproteobacteria bacterium]|nr:hypothetical protein [Betaproteobacteria bacterium]